MRTALIRLIGAFLLILPTAVPVHAPAEGPPLGVAAPAAPVRLAQAPGTTLEIGAEAFGLPLADDEVATAYPKSSVRLEVGQAVQFAVDHGCQSIGRPGNPATQVLEQSGDARVFGRAHGGRWQESCLAAC